MAPKTCYRERSHLSHSVEHEDRTKRSMRWGRPPSKVTKVLIPVFHVLLPFSRHSQLGGHKPRCASDVFSLVHTNILKLSSNLPAFKMGKYFVKTRRAGSSASATLSQSANRTTTGRAERHLSPHTQNVLDTFPCAQLFYVWPISFLLSVFPR